MCRDSLISKIVSPARVTRLNAGLVKDELRSASYRFSLLTRVTLKDGGETDLWSARDALVLKVLALVLAKQLPVSHRCTHLKGNGGAKTTRKASRSAAR
jgi:RNA-directed DNA polymerase